MTDQDGYAPHSLPQHSKPNLARPECKLTETAQGKQLPAAASCLSLFTAKHPPVCRRPTLQFSQACYEHHAHCRHLPFRTAGLLIARQRTAHYHWLDVKTDIGECILFTSHTTTICCEANTRVKPTNLIPAAAQSVMICLTRSAQAYPRPLDLHTVHSFLPAHIAAADRPPFYSTLRGMRCRGGMHALCTSLEVRGTCAFVLHLQTTTFQLPLTPKRCTYRVYYTQQHYATHDASACHCASHKMP